jgi:hypothetical protein
MDSIFKDQEFLLLTRPETSARNHHYSLRKSSEESSCYLRRGGSLKYEYES